MLTLDQLMSSTIFNIEVYEYAKTKYKLDYTSLIKTCIMSNHLELCQYIVLDNSSTSLNICEIVERCISFDNNNTYKYLTSVYYCDV